MGSSSPRGRGRVQAARVGFQAESHACLAVAFVVLMLTPVLPTFAPESEHPAPLCQTPDSIGGEALPGSVESMQDGYIEAVLRNQRGGALGEGGGSEVLSFSSQEYLNQPPLVPPCSQDAPLGPAAKVPIGSGVADASVASMTCDPQPVVESQRVRVRDGTGLPTSPAPTPGVTTLTAPPGIQEIFQTQFLEFKSTLQEWMTQRDEIMRGVIEETIYESTTTLMKFRSSASRKCRASTSSARNTKSGGDADDTNKGKARSRTSRRKSSSVSASSARTSLRESLRKSAGDLYNKAAGRTVKFEPNLPPTKEGLSQSSTPPPAPPARPLPEAFIPSGDSESNGSGGISETSSEKRLLRHTTSKVRFIEQVSEASPEESPFISEILNSQEVRVVPQSNLQKHLLRITRSHYFEIFFGVMIITNAVFIGVEIDYVAANPLQASPVTFSVVGYCYTLVFAAELLVKVAAERWSFCFAPIKPLLWNILDVLIVFTSLGEVALDIVRWMTMTDEEMSGQRVNMSNLRIIRIIRVTRLMRLFRIGRIVRFIRSLRLLVYSILSTLKTVFWAMLLLVIIMYVFAILFCQAATDYMVGVEMGVETQFLDDHSTDVLTYHWGSLTDSMISLYMCISGGVSWLDIVRPLRQIGETWLMVFLIFMTFTYFAVLNVVTGVFCQSAIESTQHDQDAMIQSFLLNKELHVARFKSLFHTIDSDMSGLISKDEFIEHIDDPQVQAYFATLELETSDALNLFKLIESDDADTDGIDIEDFVMGCLRLKGQAKSIDMARLMYENKMLSKDISDLVIFLETQFQVLRGNKTVATSEYTRHSVVAPTAVSTVAKPRQSSLAPVS